jgi:dihydrofolate reductase
VGKRAIIVAVSPEGVIGLHGGIPWKHPGDQRRFKRLTTGATVVMGRATWDEVGRPLPGRRNVVVTSRPLGVPGAEVFPSIPSALAAIGDAGDVWFIGGARIYEEAMPLCDFLDVTYVPDHVEHPDAVKFPPIDASMWDEGPLVPHEDEPGLMRRVYTRRGRGCAAAP